MKILLLLGGGYYPNLALTIAQGQSNNIIIDGPKKINTFPEYDIGVAFLYPYKIPKDEVTTKPWFNFHPGPLPEYGGRNLCYHAIMNNEDRFGATLHYMSENFDEGNIIDVKSFEITPQMNAGDVSKKSKEALLSLFEKWFCRIIENPQQKSYPNDVKYYPKIDIDNYLDLSSEDKNRIRALTAPPYYARININGRIYRITPE